MSFRLWGPALPSVPFPTHPLALLVFLTAGLLIVLLLLGSARSLGRLGISQLSVWLGSLVLAFTLSSRVLVQLQLWPDLWAGQAHAWIPVLCGVPVVLASAIGMFPAITVGLAVGLMRAAWVSHSAVDVIAMPIWAAAASYLMVQHHRGRLRANSAPAYSGESRVGSHALAAEFTIPGLVPREHPG